MRVLNDEKFSLLTKEEKHTLMIVLMRDLRGDWSNAKNRAEIVKYLAHELGNIPAFEKAKIFLANITKDTEDGRIFRDDFICGGYENAETLIDDPKCKTISKNLLRAIFAVCSYPHKILFQLLECEPL